MAAEISAFIFGVAVGVLVGYVIWHLIIPRNKKPEEPTK